MKKALLASGAIATLGIAGFVGATTVSAASETQSRGIDGLVTKIAERFSLSKDDVQKVFDEERQAREAEREQAMKERLSQAVTDGKLTQEQADLIIAKHEEMQAFRDSLTGKTDAERRAAMDEKRAELKQWAEDNDIPSGYGLFGGGRHGGFGRGERMPDTDS